MTRKVYVYRSLFRLMNLQLENKSERQDGVRNRMFLTAHKMLDTSSGFLTYSEAAIIARFYFYQIAEFSKSGFFF